MGMLSNDELKIVRDALLEGDALQRVDKIQDELEDIKFSKIFDKVKKDKEDPLTNPDKPTVDEPDFELFDEDIEYDDYGNLDIDAFEKSNDVEDLISETDKVLNQLFESEDATATASEDYDFDAFLESEFAPDNVNEQETLNESDIFGDVADIDSLEESLNVDLLESDFGDVGPLEESVILEEAEAMAQLDELSEQIIRDIESKNSDQDAHTTRKLGLYEDEDEDLAIDDDFDGIAEDYVDPADIALVDRFLGDEEDELLDEPAVDDYADEDVNPIYQEDPEADVDGDGIPDIEEPHGELPADYEPSDYDEYDHGYVGSEDLDECNSMEESEEFTESDDLSFLFESDDESDSDEDDEESDEEDGDESDDSNEDEDDGEEDDIDFDDEDEDSNSCESDSDDENDDDESDDEDDSEDEDEDDEDLDLSFDEDEDDE